MRPRRYAGWALCLVTVVVIVACAAGDAGAAVGCTLNDPDRDILRIFPDATNYATDFIAISDRGGDKLALRLETLLADTLDPVYESLDVPYAYYTVLAGGDTIGRVHGVNEKGEFGGMQIILATTPDGEIVDMYYQRLSSPHAKALRSDAFVSQFIGLTLKDFCRFRERGEGPAGSIDDPTEKGTPDVAATRRGVAKNLFLLNAFHLGGACDGTRKGGNDEPDDGH
ncbi:MAG: hypothetical protein GF405_11195 [Candidatus Eisenbacteria bacterium]|nr:hypothetical protein [Candidatus Eisenbacteria bacterium]